MTKGELERYLAQGLSLEAIGARVDKHPTTVAYHLKKHGLVAVNWDRYAGRGGIAREQLEALVAENLTLRELGERLDRSISTIRYWLKRYGLDREVGGARRAEARRAREAGAKYAMLRCRHHGRTRFILENRGSFRCMQCRKERVSAWRRRVKRRLVEEAGGACAICGYDRCVAALHFHHLDPSQKLFALSREGVTRSFAEAQAEARKCLLLCSNCHAEVETGITKAPLRADAA